MARHAHIGGRGHSTPSSPPPPPPPPTPPPSGFTDIAQLVVASPGGIVEVGVPLAPSVKAAVGAALINGTTVAQVDNVATDINGWVRYSTLTAILAPGTYTISVSEDPET